MGPGDGGRSRRTDRARVQRGASYELEAGMQTQVSILHHDYPAPVRESVDAKLQNLLRFHGGIVTMRALLERHEREHRVELVANVGRGAVLVVDAREDQFGRALEAAYSRMERLLKRDHERRTERRRPR
jgi:ribosomal subunit interface protein